MLLIPSDTSATILSGETRKTAAVDRDEPAVLSNTGEVTEGDIGPSVTVGCGVKPGCLDCSDSVRGLSCDNAAELIAESTEVSTNGMNPCSLLVHYKQQG